MKTNGTKLSESRKRENIAVRLAGRVKNFTGKGPDVIRVKIDKGLVTVRLKWLLTEQERKYLYNCKRKNLELIGTMRNNLNEQLKNRLLRVVAQLFDGQVEILGIDEERFQENISIRVQVWEKAS